MTERAPLLSVRELRVVLPRLPRLGDSPPTRDEVVAVDGAGFDVGAGEVVALVGESGAGKSMAASAIMGLAPPGARISGQVWFGAGEERRDLLSLSQRQLREVRGRGIGWSFQDATAALNPIYSLGRQVAEAVKLGRGLRGKAARRAAVELLGRVGVQGARAQDYPHQLSGGMRQRVMLAIALAGEPALLIADEPTASLDSPAAAQLVALLAQLQRERNLALLVISHDLPLVAEIAERVAVMYAGQIVESGPAGEVMGAPEHPYTRALLGCIPPLRQQRKRVGDAPAPLPTIPSARALGAGCRFSPRCALAVARCAEEPPLFSIGERRVRCFVAADERGVA